MSDAELASRSLATLLLKHPPGLPVFPGWPRERVLTWIEEQHRHLFRGASLAGEVIALPLANDVTSLLALLLIGAAGGAGMPMGPDATGYERTVMMERGGGSRMMISGEVPQLAGMVGSGSDLIGGMVLHTSASTGAAKLARRSLESLIDEGQRYVELLKLPAGARVLMPAPIVHAYALGWLVACLMGGWCLVPLPPTALRRISDEMRQGADWAVMTPALARLLAARPDAELTKKQPAPCRVMVGAGPVTAELEQSFRAKFSIGLARNYGSTETGAVLAGFEDLPPGYVGFPMPGVRHRIVDDLGGPVSDATPGFLEIATAAGWHAMGDLVRADASGRIAIIGRSTEAVRRGDRWIAPLDVQAHLSAFPGLRAVRVSKMPKRGDSRDRMAVDVWPNDPSCFDRIAFSSFIESRLEPAMRPDQVRVRALLVNSEGGKLRASAIWRRASAMDTAAIARAYKRAELLFALNATGVLGALDGRKSTDDIADELGLDSGALDVLLAIAARFGIVVQEDEVLAEPKHSDVADLEAELSRTFVNRDQIAALLCTGLSHGNPLAKSDALMDPYLRVMNGDSTRFRVNFGLRALGLHARSRILEVTAGPGMYGRIAAARQAGIAHTVWPVGPAARMGGDPPLPPDLPEHVFDAIVLFNGLRWSPIPERLGELKKLMRRPSVLLIDDLFLQDDDVSAEFALDWVTHGGAAFMTLVELTTALSMQGFDVEVKSVPGSVYARIVVARLL